MIGRFDGLSLEVWTYLTACTGTFVVSGDGASESVEPVVGVDREGDSSRERLGIILVLFGGN